jgi:hypothetical protein
MRVPRDYRFDETTSANTKATMANAQGHDLTVDIVISNHNYGPFLADAIDSACAQNYSEVTVIVVDDGSTDGSRDVLSRYATIVDVVLKDNGGQASAMNAGLERCRGEAVMFLDADDTLKPDAAARVAAAFADDRSLSKVQFRMEVIDAFGRPTGWIKPAPGTPMPDGDARPAELAFPFDLPWAGCSGNAYRLDALRRIIPIPERDYPVRGADWYLVHLTTLLGRVRSLPDVCACYRLHGNNGYHPQVAELDLRYVRESISYSRVTARALSQLADELGLERPRPILSISDLSNRLISLKLQPELHVLPDDRAWRLVCDSARAAHRRFDVAWRMKVAFVGWFAAMAVAPKPVARRLAEWFVLPERRPSLAPWRSAASRLRSVSAGHPTIR